MESNMEYHLPITPVGPAPQESVKRSPVIKTRKKFLLCITLICIVVALALGIVANMIQKRQADNESKAMIQDLENSNAIRMNIQLKRPSISTGSSDAAVSAYLMTSRNDPMDALRIDARLTYTSGDLRYHYLLQNLRGYMTVINTTTETQISSGCLDPSQIPPLDSIEQVLRNGRVIDRYAYEYDDLELTNCPEDAKLIEITFAGEPYIICRNNQQGETTYVVYGEDLSTEFQFLSPTDTDNAHEALPNIVQAFSAENLNVKVKSCLPLGGNPLANTSAPQPLLRDNVIESADSSKRRLSSLSRRAEGPQCTHGLRPCLFIHGIGVASSSPSTNSSPGFGSIHEQTPCCSETKFVQIDTVTQKWFDPDIEDRLCDEAVQLSGKNDGILTVVSHSMGNLMFANALNSRKCAISSNLLNWIAIAGPISGSKTADMLINRCNKEDGGEFDDVPDILVALAGRCPVAASYYSVVLQNGNYSTQELNRKFRAAQRTYEKYVSSVLCGTSSSGLASPDSLGLSLVAKYTGHGSANDGVVELDSCQARLEQKNWQASYESAFYEASINHMDSAFRNGDGWWGLDRKPIKWLQNQM